MSIKPPAVGQPGIINQPPEGMNPTGKSDKNVTLSPQIVNPEAIAKALKDYNKLKKDLKKPFLSGAAGLFTDNIAFPAELLDPQNPANDPKYLHLLSSMLGIEQLEQYFGSREQAEEEPEDEGDEEESGSK